MSMFGALVPKQDSDFGTESYEEVVDNFCIALEDVESEIAGLEALNDSIDNAEAFAAAIESCGATPALMQFGYACDDSFEQLIGRAAPSSFATEDMEEFGSFALESIRSKLTLAWEAVKAFIVRIWEKLKEFGRWILSLFDRKEAKLRAIIKAAKDKEVKKKPFAGGEKNDEKRHVRCYSKSKINELLGSANLFAQCDSTIKALGGLVKHGLTGDGSKIGKIAERIKEQAATAVRNSFKMALDANTRTGAITLKNELKNAFKEQTLKDAGFTSWKDIYDMGEECIKGLGGKQQLDAAVKDFSDFVKGANDGLKEAEKRARDIEGDHADKLDREETARKDYKRADEITMYRVCSVMASKTVVLCGKIVNNCCASVIAVANCAGL